MMRHTPTRLKTARARRRAGLTLVELMLATAGTAMIGAAIVSMLTAISYGTNSTKDMRALVIRHKALAARVTAAVRGSCMVLEADTDYLVLWAYDADESGTPDLLEIRRISYDAATDTVTSYVAVDGTTDVSYTFDTDFETTTDALISADTMAGSVWASGVSQWATSLNDDDEQAATLVSYEFQLTHNDMTDWGIGAVALRNHAPE